MKSCPSQEFNCPGAREIGQVVKDEVKLKQRARRHWQLERTERRQGSAIQTDPAGEIRGRYVSRMISAVLSPRHDG
jgi:hypothetical protein